ncbi:hypothetical protein KE513_12730 [Oscillospiraceae bacterium Marseille-Q3528]|nr:hypothetical protein [Oscillospiraceae bacterium Marseille-Q3528]
MTGMTEIRMREIDRRTRQYRRRTERRVLFCLTACSMFLLAGMGILLGNTQVAGISSVAEGYGAVLLRSGAGLYVIVGVAAFVVGMTLTVICIRCRKNSGNRTLEAEESEE